MLSQGKDFAPRQHPKQAQRAPTSAKGPAQASRKRKAQQENHTFANTGSRPTPRENPSCCDTPGQAGQASRHDRLKSISSRRKPAPPSEGATPSRAGVTAPQHSRQQSCSVADAQQATGSLPLPGSTLQAQVSGVPHTQLVLSTMQQLSRTLSSEPHTSASAQGLSQPGMPALAISAAAAAAAVSSSVASAASAQAQATEPAEQLCVQQSMSAGAPPVLQPFLAATVDEAQACQNAPELVADPCMPLQDADEKAPADSCSQSPPQLGSVSPHMCNPLHTGEGQVEGQAERQADWQGSEQAERQPQKQKASAFEQKEAGPTAHMQTGSALQQLISRAQKLKEQLDAHAARRYDKQVHPSSVLAVFLTCVSTTLCQTLHRDAVQSQCNIDEPLLSYLWEGEWGGPRGGVLITDTGYVFLILQHPPAVQLAMTIMIYQSHYICHGPIKHVSHVIGSWCNISCLSNVAGT